MSDSLRLLPTLGASGWGVRIESAGMALTQPRPVAVVTADGTSAGRATGYADLRRDGDEWLGTGRILIGDGASVEVVDRWAVVDGAIRVCRSLEVRGSAPAGFGSRLSVQRAGWSGTWADVMPFIPGVTYGDARRVAAGALGGRPARAAGVRTVLVREDRAAAPLAVVAFPDGAWLAVLHVAPDAATTAEDCRAVDGGDLLCDDRFRFASLGGTTVGEAPDEAGSAEIPDAAEGLLEIGVWFPGTEGEHTYSSGGLPLEQPHVWRRRLHPARDGLRQDYEVRFRVGRGTGLADVATATWRWAWQVFSPAAPQVDTDTVMSTVVDVLASQVVTSGGRTGVPLEADAADADDLGCASSAVVGFVGANTDVGYLLLRVADARGGAEGAELRRRGEAILDTFTTLALDPPEGEGFDLVTDAVTTYRAVDGRPAVHARAVAEGCLAMLRADEWERHRGRLRPAWSRWWQTGARWLVRQQAPDGSLPRAWEAGSGAVIDPSPSSSGVVVPFLVAAAAATGQDHLLEAAIAAGDHAWAEAQRSGCFAGATLDNPDVVDKEAAILAAEGFLDLFDATGGPVWLERAMVAASLAETWIYIWDVPMPGDANPAELHWKPEASTVGHQLIVTGASMTDGFLAVNAAAFTRLWRATGDQHWLDVARLVTHGTTAMLALPGRTFDLRGPGWQQEHWCFAGRRGYGLNRRWLPWVPVAHALGILRVADLGPEWAGPVLRPGKPQ